MKLQDILHRLNGPKVLFLVRAVCVYANIIRIACIDDILHADHQGGGGGYRHQHHRGQNAYGGKPHGVLFHPVDHAGYADKVTRPIVIVFVLFQEL
ncbi:hypothetical protein SDC9_203961 [bioreactor metagenome]|uniref:Uncharacterized protein n=1 Tax=bioreactor metagenome TaxID=1076179 RepID=A0A645IXV8_9ZZZZ